MSLLIGIGQKWDQVKENTQILQGLAGTKIIEWMGGWK